MPKSRYGVLVMYPDPNNDQPIFDGGTTRIGAQRIAEQQMTELPIRQTVVYPVMGVKDETWVLTREDWERSGSSGWQTANAALMALQRGWIKP
jgi:hypothetical protein